MSNMKYKVGDIVTIRQWDAMAREFGIGEDGAIKKDDGYIFLKEMKYLCGAQVDIINVLDGNYRVRDLVNHDTWSIHDWAIAHNFTYGEEIDVSDDGINWESDGWLFVGYIDGAEFRFTTTDKFGRKSFREKKEYDTWIWKYARKIVKPKFEVDVRLNGKPYDGKIPLETARKMGLVE